MSLKRRPEFVYFDLGNVLLAFDHQIACQSLSTLCQRPAEQVQEVVFDSGRQQQYETGRLSTQEFYDEFCDALQVSPPIEEVCRAASAIFSPIYSMLPIVAHLQRTGVKIGILSNTCAAHWDYIFDGRYRFVNELFGCYALSFEIKSSKPDKVIYEQASKLCGHPPETIFFVDDRAENVQGAREAGYDAELFEDAPSLTRQLHSRGLAMSL